MSSIETTTEEANRPEAFLEQVKLELDKIVNPRQNLLQKIGILLLSLIVFASLGFFQRSLSGIVIVVVVLFIHEAGHFVGMRAFRYRDVQMFFIPLFGAAVSGVESNPSSIRKAVVSLLGPVPGIILGIICAIIFFKTKQDVFAASASALLFINGFNLLPFHPLDGGRFFDYLLFSRNPKIEITFKVITGLSLGGLAFLLKDYFLGFFALFAFFSLRGTFLSANIAHQIKGNIALDELSQNSIPDTQLLDTVTELKNKLITQSDNPKLIAKYVHDIWQRARNKPASITATLGMLTIYLFFIIIGIGAPFIFEAVKFLNETETKIEKNLDKDGSYTAVAVRYFHKQKISEMSINNAGLYHGVGTNWWVGIDKKRNEGTWKNGYWHGEWKSWDKEGKLLSVTEYEMGKPVRFAVMKDGSLADLPEDKWPSIIKKSIQKHPEGPNEISNKPVSNQSDK